MAVVLPLEGVLEVVEAEATAAAAKAETSALLLITIIIEKLVMNII